VQSLKVARWPAHLCEVIKRPILQHHDNNVLDLRKNSGHMQQNPWKAPTLYANKMGPRASMGKLPLVNAD